MVKTIAVWGSPNSGKTTTSIQLALALSAQTNRSVLVLFTDDTTPVLPVVFPSNTNASSTSFGKILSLAEPTGDDILRFTCSDSSNKKCFFLGYGDCENIFTYATATEQKYRALLHQMETLFDFVIVDCTSVPNTLSKVAMSMAGLIYRLHTPDFKSVTFFSSQLPIMADPAYQLEKHISVLNIPFKDVASAVEDAAGKALYRIEYCKDIRHKFFDGETAKRCTKRPYAKAMGKMLTEIVPPPPKKSRTSKKVVK